MGIASAVAPPNSNGGSRASSMGGRRSSSSSSGEEDGDAQWRAAIDSVTSSATLIQHNTNGLPPPPSGSLENHEDEIEKHRPKKIKHYQIKGQKMLENILDETIEVVTDTAHIQEKDPVQDGAGVRLLRRAPSGIVFDHVDELLGPKKKPKIVPGEELDEKSKKFRQQLQSVAVEGADIISRARAEQQKSLAKLEAREVAAKAAAKREEERVGKLKKMRGERWLPCLAWEMRENTQSRR